MSFKLPLLYLRENIQHQLDLRLGGDKEETYPWVVSISGGSAYSHSCGLC
jgi:hypothetical protein